MIREKQFRTAMDEAVFFFCIGNNLKFAKIFIEQVIQKPIYKIEMMNCRLFKDYIHTKEKTLDYLVLTDNGYVNIEINNYNNSWRIKRDVSYACKILSNSVSKSGEYDNMQKVIQININRLGETEKGYEVYRLNATEEYKGFPKLLTDVIEIYMVNIDFYKKMVYNGNKKFIKKNYLLCAMDLTTNDIDKISEGNEELMEFKKMLEEINSTEDFVKWDYEKDAEMIHNSIVSEARREGLQQGLQEGLEQGLEQGLQEGLEQGKKEKQIEIAEKMLIKQISIEQIVEITGLTEKEIYNLKKN